MSDITPIKTLVTIETLNIASASNNSGQTPNPLSSVTNGTFVDGFVVNRTPQNLPVLRTPMGDVLINTPLFMKTGTEVTIRVDHSQPHMARIITIDGKSPEIFAEQQEAQRALGSRDSLQSQMASAVSTQSGTPKPVNLQGIILQLVARDALPANVADSLFRALGLDKTQRTGQPYTPQPLSLVLKSITMPSGSPAQEAATPAPSSGNRPSQPIATTAQPTQQPIAAITQPLLPAAPAKTSALPADDAQLLPQKTEQLLTARAPQTQPAQPATQSIATLTPEAADQPATQPQSLQTTPPSQRSSSAANAVQTDAKPPQSSAPTAAAPLRIEQQNTGNTPATQPFASKTGGIQQTQPSNILPQQIQAASVRSQTVPQQKLSLELTPQKTVAMQALVIGHEQGGDTIVHSPIGSMRIFTQKPLPQGTVMMLEVSPPTADLNKPAISHQPFLQNIAQEIESQALKDWPALSSLTEALSKQDAPMLQQFMAASLPSPGKHLTQTMLFFLAALKGGDVKQWIGQKSLEAMEQKYSDTIKRLGAEFSAMQPLLTDPAPQQSWVSASIPVYVEQKLEHIKLYVKQDDAKEGSKSATNGQRFVIDVELSRLGALQFDGFVHKEPTRKQFDLMVRSAQTLPPEAEQDIRTIFLQSIEAMGFTGSILFQPSREKFISIPNHHIAKDLGGIIA